MDTDEVANDTVIYRDAVPVELITKCNDIMIYLASDRSAMYINASNTLDALMLTVPQVRLRLQSGVGVLGINMADAAPYMPDLIEQCFIHIEAAAVAGKSTVVVNEITLNQTKQKQN